MAQESKIAELLAPYGAFVTYVPLRTEVDWRKNSSLPEGAVVYEIAPRAALDPAKEAIAAMNMIGDRTASILIPGRMFDAFGTRHGQGGGWYDRFLAEVPREWLRIGFCFEEQFSQEPLLRQPWDQAMDIVCVIANDIDVHDMRARA